MQPYDHKTIEQKWQQQWAKEKVDKTNKFDQSKEKFFMLDMLPYPSGDGLHMGHTESYTASDIMYRFKRMQGYHVLHPQAFDSFGLPAENYAIKTGVHPAETTVTNGENYIRQMKSLGLGYDYDDVFYTSSPEYYRWTQWLFSRFFENDLVYPHTQTVNWCPSCNTTLANEQVEQGECERCKSEVVQKEVPGWYFRITNFADELIHKEGDSIDWPEHTKKNQNAWIGKSEGSEIEFALKDTELSTKVFTTRADTLFGATFLVLAPENELVGQLEGKIQNIEKVNSYIQTTAKKTELERLENKEKTGVQLEGVWAINPANKEEIPVFIADYVLAGYGTGAIMAVPAHDERDREFAQKFNLPVVEVVESGEGPHTGFGKLCNSGEFDGMDSEEAKRAITEHVSGTMTSTYRLKDWSISRQRYWGCPIPIVYDPEGQAHLVPDEHLPWTLPTDVDFVPKGTAPLAESKELRDRTERIFGEGWRPEVDTMDTFVCSSWYYLRYPDPQNTNEWCSEANKKYWQPVDLYIGGAEHTYMHLLYARFWVKAMHSIDLVDYDEPFKKLRHQGYVLDEHGKKMSKSKGNVVNPDEVVERFGADATRLYMMFAGPLEDEVMWNENGVVGMYRFIEKVWRQQEKLVDSTDTSTHALVHKTIKKVTDDVERLRFNTAISAMMICVNEMDRADEVSTQDYKDFVLLLSVFAPHVTQEILSSLGESKYVSDRAWPSYDESLLVDDAVTLAVQVNGKMRGKVEVAPDAEESHVLEAAYQNESVAKWVEGDVKKVIYVPGKILNIIVS